MFYEKLSLEAIASYSHWEVVKPPTLTGNSGVTHRFGFIAKTEERTLAFEICERLTVTDVIRIYIKKFDTGASVYIICPDERISEGARRLLSEYGIDVLHPDSMGSAFKKEELPRAQSRRSILA